MKVLAQVGVTHHPKEYNDDGCRHADPNTGYYLKAIDTGDGNHKVKVRVTKHKCSVCGYDGYYSSRCDVPPGWRLENGRKICEECIVKSRSWSGKFNGAVKACVQLPGSRGRVLRFIEKCGATNQDIVDGLGVSMSTANHSTRVLRTAGFLDITGVSNARKVYSITPEGREALKARIGDADEKH